MLAELHHRSVGVSCITFLPLIMFGIGQKPKSVNGICISGSAHGSLIAGLANLVLLSWLAHLFSVLHIRVFSNSLRWGPVHENYLKEVCGGGFNVYLH